MPLMELSYPVKPQGLNQGGKATLVMGADAEVQNCKPAEEARLIV